jgi:drug/metabolite transporter (DMT)-like permease
MNFSDTTKGFLFALISVIAVSNVYIFSKAALMEVQIAQFGVYWFGFGLLWILIFAWYKKTYKIIKEITLKSYLILIILAVNQVVSTYFFFKAIHAISNPSIVSFISNITPVLVIFFSFIILKERFNKIEFLGIILALLGAFIISYKGNTKLNSMFINGSQFILYSSIFSATNAVIVKRNIHKIHPIILTISRSFFLFIFSFGLLKYLNLSLQIPITAFKNIFIGSVLGPFLTVVTGYISLKYIPLSQKAIIMSTKGLFVLFGSYLYFGNFPRWIAILGGLITIIGVLLITYGKIKKKQKVNIIDTNR